MILPASQTDFLPILTERLILRNWCDADREPFAAICSDPRVMKFLTALPTREESDAYVDRLIEHQRDHGFTFWVMEDRDTGAFAGATGLRHVGFKAHFTPAVEIGWRMPVAFWGRGLVTEAARACLHAGFQVFDLPEIVAFASQHNHRSQAVMQRLGMNHDPTENFSHPNSPPDHFTQPCVLYRIGAETFRQTVP